MFQGSMVALVTPMRDDGRIDYADLERLVAFHLEQGTDAIVRRGTTGEASTLSFEEHIEVVRQIVNLVRGRIPVIAGTGANATREAIELTQAAKQAGADACLLVCPYYIKPTQEGLYLHHKAVAEAVAIPQILYNVPGRTACDMLPATVARLAQVPHIVGIKEATGDLSRIDQILALCGERIEVYTGDDATALQAILRGARGDISVTANVAPALMHEMCMAALAGDAARATELNQQLALLHQRLFLESNPIPVKWAVQQMGLIPGGIRLPLTPLAESHHEPLREAMRQAGIKL